MSGVTLSTLVEAAMTGRPYNQARFGEAVKRYARKITNQTCRDFAEDLHEEVAQQAVVQLFTFGADALAGRSGQALLRRAVLSAIRVVRSDYAPPGQRTRPPVKGKPQPINRVAAEGVEWVLAPETVDRALEKLKGAQLILFDSFKSSAAAHTVKRMEDEVELEWALRRAPPAVATALRAVCVEGETLTIAAARVDMTRFTLSRRMDAFCPLWREAA
jgi:hypothetical protein